MSSNFQSSTNFSFPLDQSPNRSELAFHRIDPHAPNRNFEPHPGHTDANVDSLFAAGLTITFPSQSVSHFDPLQNTPHSLPTHSPLDLQQQSSQYDPITIETNTSHSIVYNNPINTVQSSLYNLSPQLSPGITQTSSIHIIQHNQTLYQPHPGYTLLDYTRTGSGVDQDQYSNVPFFSLPSKAVPTTNKDFALQLDSVSYTPPSTVLYMQDETSAVLNSTGDKGERYLTNERIINSQTGDGNNNNNNTTSNDTNPIKPLHQTKPTRKLSTPNYINKAKKSGRSDQYIKSALAQMEVILSTQQRRTSQLTPFQLANHHNLNQNDESDQNTIVPQIKSPAGYFIDVIPGFDHVDYFKRKKDQEEQDELDQLSNLLGETLGYDKDDQTILDSNSNSTSNNDGNLPNIMYHDDDKVSERLLLLTNQSSQTDNDLLDPQGDLANPPRLSRHFPMSGRKRDGDINNMSMNDDDNELDFFSNNNLSSDTLSFNHPSSTTPFKTLRSSPNRTTQQNSDFLSTIPSMLTGWGDEELGRGSNGKDWDRVDLDSDDDLSDDDDIEIQFSSLTSSNQQSTGRKSKKSKRSNSSSLDDIDDDESDDGDLDDDSTLDLGMMDFDFLLNLHDDLDNTDDSEDDSDINDITSQQNNSTTLSDNIQQNKVNKNTTHHSKYLKFLFHRAKSFIPSQSSSSHRSPTPLYPLTSTWGQPHQPDAVIEGNNNFPLIPTTLDWSTDSYYDTDLLRSRIPKAIRSHLLPLGLENIPLLAFDTAVTFLSLWDSGMWIPSSETLNNNLSTRYFFLPPLTSQYIDHDGVDNNHFAVLVVIDAFTKPRYYAIDEVKLREIAPQSHYYANEVDQLVTPVYHSIARVAFRDICVTQPSLINFRLMGGEGDDMDGVVQKALEQGDRFASLSSLFNAQDNGTDSSQVKNKIIFNLIDGFGDGDDEFGVQSDQLDQNGENIKKNTILDNPNSLFWQAYPSLNSLYTQHDSVPSYLIPKIEVIGMLKGAIEGIKKSAEDPDEVSPIYHLSSYQQSNLDRTQDLLDLILNTMEIIATNDVLKLAKNGTAVDKFSTGLTRMSLFTEFNQSNLSSHSLTFTALCLKQLEMIINTFLSSISATASAITATSVIQDGVGVVQSMISRTSPILPSPSTPFYYVHPTTPQSLAVLAAYHSYQLRPSTPLSPYPSYAFQYHGGVDDKKIANVISHSSNLVNFMPISPTTPFTHNINHPNAFIPHNVSLFTYAQNKKHQLGDPLPSLLNAMTPRSVTPRDHHRQFHILNHQVDGDNNISIDPIQQAKFKYPELFPPVAPLPPLLPQSTKVDNNSTMTHFLSILSACCIPYDLLHSIVKRELLAYGITREANNDYKQVFGVNIELPQLIQHRYLQTQYLKSLTTTPNNFVVLNKINGNNVDGSLNTNDPGQGKMVITSEGRRTDGIDYIIEPFHPSLSTKPSSSLSITLSDIDNILEEEDGGGDGIISSNPLQEKMTTVSQQGGLLAHAHSHIHVGAPNNRTLVYSMIITPGHDNTVQPDPYEAEGRRAEVIGASLPMKDAIRQIVPASFQHRVDSVVQVTKEFSTAGVSTSLFHNGGNDDVDFSDDDGDDNFDGNNDNNKMNHGHNLFIEEPKVSIATLPDRLSTHVYARSTRQIVLYQIDIDNMANSLPVVKGSQQNRNDDRNDNNTNNNDNFLYNSSSLQSPHYHSPSNQIQGEFDFYIPSWQPHVEFTQRAELTAPMPILDMQVNPYNPFETTSILIDGRINIWDLESLSNPNPNSINTSYPRYYDEHDDSSTPYKQECRGFDHQYYSWRESTRNPHSKPTTIRSQWQDLPLIDLWWLGSNQRQLDILSQLHPLSEYHRYLVDNALFLNPSFDRLTNRFYYQQHQSDHSINHHIPYFHAPLPTLTRPPFPTWAKLQYSSNPSLLYAALPHSLWSLDRRISNAKIQSDNHYAAYSPSPTTTPLSSPIPLNFTLDDVRIFDIKTDYQSNPYHMAISTAARVYLYDTRNWSEPLTKWVIPGVPVAQRQHNERSFAARNFDTMVTPEIRNISFIHTPDLRTNQRLMDENNDIIVGNVGGQLDIAGGASMTHNTPISSYSFGQFDKYLSLISANNRPLISTPSLSTTNLAPSSIAKLPNNANSVMATNLLDVIAIPDQFKLFNTAPMTPTLFSKSQTISTFSQTNRGTNLTRNLTPAQSHITQQSIVSAYRTALPPGCITTHSLIESPPQNTQQTSSINPSQTSLINQQQHQNLPINYSTMTKFIPQRLAPIIPSYLISHNTFLTQPLSRSYLHISAFHQERHWMLEYTSFSTAPSSFGPNTSSVTMNPSTIIAVKSCGKPIPLHLPVAVMMPDTIFNTLSHRRKIVRAMMPKNQPRAVLVPPVEQHNREMRTLVKSQSVIGQLRKAIKKNLSSTMATLRTRTDNLHQKYGLPLLSNNTDGALMGNDEFSSQLEFRGNENVSQTQSNGIVFKTPSHKAKIPHKMITSVRAAVTAAIEFSGLVSKKTTTAPSIGMRRSNTVAFVPSLQGKLNHDQPTLLTPTRRRFGALILNPPPLSDSSDNESPPLLTHSSSISKSDISTHRSNKGVLTKVASPPKLSKNNQLITTSSSSPKRRFINSKQPTTPPTPLVQLATRHILHDIIKKGKSTPLTSLTWTFNLFDWSSQIDPTLEQMSFNKEHPNDIAETNRSNRSLRHATADFGFGNTNNDKNKQQKGISSSISSIQSLPLPLENSSTHFSSFSNGDFTKDGDGLPLYSSHSDGAMDPREILIDSMNYELSKGGRGENGENGENDKNNYANPLHHKPNFLSKSEFDFSSDYGLHKLLYHNALRTIRRRAVLYRNRLKSDYNAWKAKQFQDPDNTAPFRPSHLSNHGFIPRTTVKRFNPIPRSSRAKIIEKVPFYITTAPMLFAPRIPVTYTIVSKRSLIPFNPSNNHGTDGSSQESVAIDQYELLRTPSNVYNIIQSQFLTPSLDSSLSISLTPSLHLPILTTLRMTYHAQLSHSIYRVTPHVTLLPTPINIQPIVLKTYITTLFSGLGLIPSAPLITTSPNPLSNINKKPLVDIKQKFMGSNGVVCSDDIPTIYSLNTGQPLTKQNNHTLFEDCLALYRQSTIDIEPNQLPKPVIAIETDVRDLTPVAQMLLLPQADQATREFPLIDVNPTQPNHLQVKMGYKNVTHWNLAQALPRPMVKWPLFSSYIIGILERDVANEFIRAKKDPLKYKDPKTRILYLSQKRFQQTLTQLSLFKMIHFINSIGVDLVYELRTPNSMEEVVGYIYQRLHNTVRDYTYQRNEMAAFSPISSHNSSIKSIYRPVPLLFELIPPQFLLTQHHVTRELIKVIDKHYAPDSVTRPIFSYNPTTSASTTNPTHHFASPTTLIIDALKLFTTSTAFLHCFPPPRPETLPSAQKNSGYNDDDDDDDDLSHFSLKGTSSSHSSPTPSTPFTQQFDRLHVRHQYLCVHTSLLYRTAYPLITPDESITSLLPIPLFDLYFTINPFPTNSTQSTFLHGTGLLLDDIQREKYGWEKHVASYEREVPLSCDCSIIPRSMPYHHHNLPLGPLPLLDYVNDRVWNLVMLDGSSQKPKSSQNVSQNGHVKHNYYSQSLNLSKILKAPSLCQRDNCSMLTVGYFSSVLPNDTYPLMLQKAMDLKTNANEDNSVDNADKKHLLLQDKYKDFLSFFTAVQKNKAKDEDEDDLYLGQFNGDRATYRGVIAASQLSLGASSSHQLITSFGLKVNPNAAQSERAATHFLGLGDSDDDDDGEDDRDDNSLFDAFSQSQFTQRENLRATSSHHINNGEADYEHTNAPFDPQISGFNSTSTYPKVPINFASKTKLKKHVDFSSPSPNTIDPRYAQFAQTTQHLANQRESIPKNVTALQAFCSNEDCSPGLLHEAKMVPPPTELPNIPHLSHSGGINMISSLEESLLEMELSVMEWL